MTRILRICRSLGRGWLHLVCLSARHCPSTQHGESKWFGPGYHLYNGLRPLRRSGPLFADYSNFKGVQSTPERLRMRVIIDELYSYSFLQWQEVIRPRGGDDFHHIALPIREGCEVFSVGESDPLRSRIISVANDQCYLDYMVAPSESGWMMCVLGLSDPALKDSKWHFETDKGLCAS